MVHLTTVGWFKGEVVLPFYLSVNQNLGNHVMAHCATPHFCFMNSRYVRLITAETLDVISRSLSGMYQ